MQAGCSVPMHNNPMHRLVWAHNQINSMHQHFFPCIPFPEKSHINLQAVTPTVEPHSMPIPYSSDLGHETPLHARWKPSSSTTTKTAFLHLIYYPISTFGDNILGAVPVAPCLRSLPQGQMAGYENTRLWAQDWTGSPNTAIKEHKYISG